MDSPIWNIKEMERAVTRVFGEQQWQKALPSVRSVVDRSFFAHYHYQEVQRILRRFRRKHSRAGILGAIADESLDPMLLQIRAHLTGFFQSLHALPDTCAHMIYFSLGFDLQTWKLEAREVKAYRVKNLTEGVGRGDTTLAGLVNIPIFELAMVHHLFTELSEGKDWRHVHALANTAKHRRIIRPKLIDSMRGPTAKRYTLNLETFDYGDTHFDEADAVALMVREHDRIQPLTVDLGVELTKSVQLLA